jgi:DNA-binding transcriptional ArsR family regulator
MSPRAPASTGFGGGIAAAAPLFAALGSGTRLRLVHRLSEEGPLPIARLTEGADVSRQAVTKHLHVLAGAGLVRERGRGRMHVWEVRPGRLDEARRWLDHIEGQWDEALARLKAAVERQG